MNRQCQYDLHHECTEIACFIYKENKRERVGKMKSKTIKLVMVSAVVLGILVGCGKSKENGGQESASAAKKTIELLNVSYDPTRELYDEFNTEFIAYWKEKTGQEVRIQQSHGGSGKQGRAVICR